MEICDLVCFSFIISYYSDKSMWIDPCLWLVHNTREKTTWHIWA